MGQSTLTTDERKLVIHILSTAQLSGDVEALRKALQLLDSAIAKLSSTDLQLPDAQSAES